MKSNLKFLTLIIIAFFFSIAATAQIQAEPPQKFSFGLNGGIAHGKYSSYAIGGDMRFLFNISKRLSIPITLGYTSTKEDGYTTKAGVKIKGETHDAFPLKLGIKGFISETGKGIYLLLEVGKVGLPGMKGGSGLPTVFSPAIGYGWKNGLDLAIKYEEYARREGFTGLRLGYWF